MEMLHGGRAAFKLEAGGKLTYLKHLDHRLIWTVKEHAAFSEVHWVLARKADDIV